MNDKTERKRKSHQSSSNKEESDHISTPPHNSSTSTKSDLESPPNESEIENTGDKNDSSEVATSNTDDPNAHQVPLTKKAKSNNNKTEKDASRAIDSR